jgi:2-polyprenyl-6-methoxyphenol hydroxylase-like FAD-dependent oxidoreductase
MEKPHERVAIIGSGLAGLVSANLLNNDPRQRYAVKVFESVRYYTCLYRSIPC